MAELKTKLSLLDKFLTARNQTMTIAAPLTEADSVVQPMVDVSPPKWHLAHTTWFFERFVLLDHMPNYQVYNPEYHFLFNSYYESEGERVPRDQRGFQTRPDLKSVLNFRRHVDEAMGRFLEDEDSLHDRLHYLITLGLQHEEQHQELLWTDLKYILGKQAIPQVYGAENPDNGIGEVTSSEWINVPEGVYTIGYRGEDFCFDNELGAHRVFLEPFAIGSQLVTNAEYLEFMNSGAYTNFRHWLSEAWAWIKSEGIQSPEYWQKKSDRWMHYTLDGLKPIDEHAPVTHISYYEADAFASWKGLRLPTEQEWEASQSLFNHGKLWEWTGSAYLPYPGFQKESGAIGEYNGKFMINQMVLRGASVATAQGHSRPSYRNFFHPDKRWQYNGIRLCKSLT